MIISVVLLVNVGMMEHLILELQTLNIELSGCNFSCVLDKITRKNSDVEQAKVLFDFKSELSVKPK